MLSGIELTDEPLRRCVKRGRVARRGVCGGGLTPAVPVCPTTTSAAQLASTTATPTPTRASHHFSVRSTLA